MSTMRNAGQDVLNRGHQSGFLLEPEAIELISRYGIPYPDHGLAHSKEEALDLADSLGWPVVLKIVSRDVIHKSDAGGVITGLQNLQEVRAAFKKITTSVGEYLPQAKIEAILVCKQAPLGLEVIVGSLVDPMFGPAIMFGLGGVFAEVIKDVAFRLAPLQRFDALEMIHEIKGYPLIAGQRGQKRYDEEALVELLLAVSQMISEHQDIKELDLNPVRLYKRGLLVLDVRIIQT